MHVTKGRLFLESQRTISYFIDETLPEPSMACRFAHLAALVALA